MLVVRLPALVCIVHDDSHARMLLRVVLGMDGAKPRVVPGHICVELLGHVRLTDWAMLVLIEHVVGDLASRADWWIRRGPLLLALHRGRMVGPLLGVVRPPGDTKDWGVDG